MPHSNLYHVYVGEGTVEDVHGWGQFFLLWSLQESWKWGLLSTEDRVFLSLASFSFCPAFKVSCYQHYSHFHCWLMLPQREGEEGAEEQDGRISFSFLVSLPPAAEMAGMANRDSLLPLCCPFILLYLPCKKSQEVTKCIIHHGILTEYLQPCWGKTPGH